MIKDNIRIIREQNGLTQKQVADVLGVGRATYCNYESGKRNIKPNAILKLSKFYKLPLNAFYDESEEVLNDEDGYESEGDNIYLSQLSKKEKDLIVTFRCMNKTQKKSFENLMKETLKENK
ncbi:MAG: helix-turn-helix transcriptional regulator [Clostridia bacterium]|nr:helix-turn-helix transcriptional regulator [Clostridia bacterium]MBR5543926.1 helix-turn-helix transcriptional regulator [Clostridia bacterium]